MIILRQHNFSFGGFGWAYDDSGNLRSDLTNEDKAKLGAFKKKYPNEWKEFEKNGYSDQPKSSNRSGGSSDYSRYGGGYSYSSPKKSKEVEDYEKSNRRANRITWGTWGASIANKAIRKKVNEDRRSEIDELTGHDKRMKNLIGPK